MTVCDGIGLPVIPALTAAAYLGAADGGAKMRLAISTLAASKFLATWGPWPTHRNMSGGRHILRLRTKSPRLPSGRAAARAAQAIGKALTAPHGARMKIGGIINRDWISLGMFSFEKEQEARPGRSRQAVARAEIARQCLGEHGALPDVTFAMREGGRKLHRRRPMGRGGRLCRQSRRL